MTRALRGERNGPHSAERPPESREHREVGVKRDLLQAPDAERGEAVVVLAPPKLALDSSASPVQVAELLRVSGDARKEPPAAATSSADTSPRSGS